MAEKEISIFKTYALSFTHRWTLNNFAHLYDENCQWKWNVQSDLFSPPGNEELKFSLIIWPKEYGFYGKGLQVGLCAYQVPEMWVKKVIVKEVRSIEDEKGKKVFTKVCPDTNMEANIWISDYELVPVTELLDPSTGCLRKGTLTVWTEMTLISKERFFNLPFGSPHTFSSTTIPSSVSRLSHRFTIAHFKWLCEDSTRQMPRRVNSQYFAPEREDIGQMRLQFYPKGIGGNYAEHGSIRIQNDNPSSLLVHYEFSLVDGKEKYHQKKNTSHLLSKYGETWSLGRHILLPILSSLPKDVLIIDCDVTILVPEKYEITPTSSCTFIDLALFNYHYVPFTWTIEGYLEQVSTQECTLSPLFSPPTDSRYTAFLRIYPKKEKEKVQIELNLASNCQIDECKVEWQWAVVNAKGEEWNAYESSVLEDGKETGLWKLISYKELDNCRSILLPDDKLTIKCEVWIHETLKKPRKNLSPELSNLPAIDPSADLAGSVTNLNIGDNANFSYAIIAAHSTLTTGNIAQSSVSKSAESMKPNL